VQFATSRAARFGFVGPATAGADLIDNYKMDWEFSSAENGNIAPPARLICRMARNEFTMAGLSAKLPEHRG